MTITPEYPDEDQQRTYGALCFLYMRAAKYDAIALRNMRRLMQPPIDLRFYKVLYLDDVPRAAITWAYLTEEAERKLLITGEAIAPADWAGGQNLWLMEVIAPYKEGNLGAQLTKRFLAAVKPPHDTVRFARFASPGKLKHVVEYYRADGNKWKSRRLAPSHFAQA